MKRCGHDTVRLSRRVREWAHRTFPRKRPTSVGNVSKVRMIVILACSVNLNQPSSIVWKLLCAYCETGTDFDPSDLATSCSVLLEHRTKLALKRKE
jgi:hypothetical protein